MNRNVLALLLSGFLVVSTTLLSPTSADAKGSPINLRSALISASASSVDGSPRGAVDGNRFATTPASCWQGEPGHDHWWWQVEFDQSRVVGAILQVVGDHPRNLRNAPLTYLWQHSSDGRTWHDLAGAKVATERRMFRILRLPSPITTRFVRMKITASHDTSPTLREIEFYADTQEEIDFPEWVLSISSRETQTLTTDPCEFTRLIRQCEDWQHLQVQYSWHGDIDEAFVAAEPQPLCAFLSGSFLEWCQRSREPWRGVQQVLQNGRLPMWGACGGAQILAILSETGVDQPWDCPRCRDPAAPKLPVYSHIGHTGDSPCGDYSQCIGERGKFRMRIEQSDPVLAGLPEIFEIIESHVGQIDYVPEGWQRIVTRGPGAHTVNQCLRRADRYIYAAQFHIELPGTEQNSRLLMSNFLGLAKQWGGYNPNGRIDDSVTIPPH